MPSQLIRLSPKNMQKHPARMQGVISNCESSLHNVKSQFHFAESVCTFAGHFCNLRGVSALVQGPFVIYKSFLQMCIVKSQITRTSSKRARPFVNLQRLPAFVQSVFVRFPYSSTYFNTQQKILTLQFEL